MSNYLAFLYGGLNAPQGKPFNDGKKLAAPCIEHLKRLNDHEQFPPRLLILLTSPAYLDTAKASQLIAGIHQTFTDNKYPEVPLIGSSVAAVFFKHPTLENRVHDRGALLVCLASRLINARVEFARDLRQAPQKAIDSLVWKLSVDPTAGTDPNPLADRIMLTFFPGFGKGDGPLAYPGPELQRLLREKLRARIWMMGGVSSVNDLWSAKPGLQFAGREVFDDAAVVALINSGAPIGIGLTNGLSHTGYILRANAVSADGRTIEEFDQGIPAEILRQEGGNVLLGRMSTDGEPMIAVSRMEADGRSIRLIREVNSGDYFEILRPEAAGLLAAAGDCLEQARDRLLIQTPVGSLALACNAWRDYSDKGFESEQALQMMESRLGGVPCVGGFMDGEIGVDQTGRTLFANGSIAGMVFGDEMRNRTPLNRGFAALADYGPSMTLTKSIDEAMEKALQIVIEAGFPGAMLSLKLKNGPEEFIVARKFKGKRFAAIFEDTCRSATGNDILAIVARDKKPLFIPNSSTNPHCNHDAVERSGIISQYIIPLLGLEGGSIGILQVDLGNTRSLSKSQRRVLDSLWSIVGATLNRIINWVVTEIGSRLDEASNKSLSASTVEEAAQCLIEEAIQVFGVQMGVLRLADHENRKLLLVAGKGPLFEAGRETRQSVSFDDATPLCLAFREPGVRVINDAQNDPGYRWMRTAYATDFRLIRALDEVKSYAALAFHNEKGEPIGTFSLVSDQKWFFTQSQVIALRTLSKRFGQVVEHIKNKRPLEFILNANPRLAEIKNLDDLSGELKTALEKFCRQMNADYSSLYLWDKGREQYILRAAYNWHKPEWVNAARYPKDYGWTGTSAVGGEPIHIPDLYQHYHDKKYEQRYTKEAFGFLLSAKHSVEAVGIPLKVEEHIIGILTLYRRKQGALSGFSVTDPKVLQEGASDLAGLVRVLQARQDKRREEEGLRCRRELYDLLNEQDDHRFFDAQVCQAFLRTFPATRVDFYKVSGDPRQLLWQEGFGRDRSTGEPVEVKRWPEELRDLLEQALRENQGRRVRVGKHIRKLTESQRKNPRLAKTEGLAERVCIPLIGDRKWAGLLDVHWDMAQNEDGTGIQQDEKYLRLLGEMIGGIYAGHEIKHRAEQSKLASQAGGAYSFQHSHRLGNAVQRIYRQAQLANESTDEQGRLAALQELQDTVETAMDITRSAQDHGERVGEVFCKNYSLLSLVQYSISRIDADKLRLIQDEKIKLAHTQLENFPVYVDFELATEAFVNLLNNGIQAVINKNGDWSKADAAADNRLTITALPAKSRRNVMIVFKDTGIGMSQAQIDTAMSGFFATRGHRGVGVLISRVLLSAQGGKLEYRSMPGHATEAIVTLPLAVRLKMPFTPPIIQIPS